MRNGSTFPLALWAASAIMLATTGSGAQVLIRPSSAVRVTTGWYAAEVEGRLLWVSEQSVALQVDGRTELQVGWQRFVAKGRARTNRFSASARWFSVEHILREEGNRRLVLSVRRLEDSEGVADVAEGLFTWVAPRIDTTSLLSVEVVGGRAAGYRLSYSRIHAGTEAADTIGFMAVAGRSQANRWQAQVEGGIYVDRHRGTTYRPVVSGSVGFTLGRGVQARIGATVALQGFPYAGIPIEALTAFALYQPGSVVESWRDRPAGFLTIQLLVGR